MQMVDKLGVRANETDKYVRCRLSWSIVKRYSSIEVFTRLLNKLFVTLPCNYSEGSRLARDPPTPRPPAQLAERPTCHCVIEPHCRPVVKEMWDFLHRAFDGLVVRRIILASAARVQLPRCRHGEGNPTFFSKRVDSGALPTALVDVGGGWVWSPQNN